MAKWPFRICLLPDQLEIAANSAFDAEANVMFAFPMSAFAVAIGGKADIGTESQLSKELARSGCVGMRRGPSMEATIMSNPKSTASIAGHPIHPMLIPFPIAFFVATFVCDLAYWQTSNGAWAIAAIWLLGAGLIMAALAAVAGLIDVFGEPRIRVLKDVWWHAGGNVFVVLIQIYSFYARYSEETSAIVPKGLVLSLVVVCTLLFTGWKGWEMVYRHRVGVADTIESRQIASTAPRRAA